MEQDVSAYYNQTQNHYQRWWKLDEGMSLHYGLWYKETRNFVEALGNTNQYMADRVGVKINDRVLDAGCGVGGAAIFLAQTYSAKVTGLSLSELQIETARKNGLKYEVDHLVNFELGDFTKTPFEDESFDIIWACESSSSVPDKTKMLKEWKRLLKPGGKIILLDFFKVPGLQADEVKLLDKWSEIWAMSPLVTVNEIAKEFTQQEIELVHHEDLTKEVTPTIRWMYKSYLLGSLPAILYNTLFGARKYSRNHYKSGLYQYRGHKRGLWKYYALRGQKK
jgi:ubiquinone/menaquinone biosynthesis C-methylase UbiE